MKRTFALMLAILMAFSLFTALPLSVVGNEPPPPPIFSHNGGVHPTPFNLTIDGHGYEVRFTTDGSAVAADSPLLSAAIPISYISPTRDNSPMSIHGVGRANPGYWNVHWAEEGDNESAYIWPGNPRIPDDLRTPSGYFEPNLIYNGMTIRATAFGANGVPSETITKSFFIDRPDMSWENSRILSIVMEPDNFVDMYRNRNDSPVQTANIEMFCENGGLLINQPADVKIFDTGDVSFSERSIQMDFGDGYIVARTSDIEGTNMRDPIAQLMAAPLRHMTYNIEYSAVFVNGEFWGMYNLYSPADSINRDDIAAFLTETCGCCGRHDNRTRQWFDHLRRVVCIDEFIDQFIINYHFENANQDERIFNLLLQNPYFANIFAARYSTYASTVFHPARVERIIQEQVDVRYPIIGRHLYRWGWHADPGHPDTLLGVPWMLGDRSTSPSALAAAWLGASNVSWPPHTVRGERGANQNRFNAHIPRPENNPTTVIIHQIYGQGTPGANAVSHGFIELYNPTDEPINLHEHSIQIQMAGDPAAENATHWNLLSLPNHTMPPRTSFLIVSSDWYNLGDDDHTPRYIIPAYDVSWDLQFCNRAMSVALVSNQERLSPMITDDEAIHVIDLVGVLNSGPPRDVAFNYLGEEPAFRISRQEVARRINFRNTRENSADFEGVRFGDFDENELENFRPRYSGDGEWEFFRAETGRERNLEDSLKLRACSECPQNSIEYIRNILDVPSGYASINWRTDASRGWFDIAGAQIRADIFDREDIDYSRTGSFPRFRTGNFSARYLRTLPVEVAANALPGYVFSHFEISGDDVYVDGYLTQDSIVITPAANASSITITAIFLEKPTTVIINHIYGQGSPGENAVSHGFIELYNPTNVPISLHEFSLQIQNIRNGSGINRNPTAWEVLPLTEQVIRPRHSLLVVSTAWYNIADDTLPVYDHTPIYIIPAYDISWDVEFSNRNFSVALVRNQLRLSPVITTAEMEDVVDLVGAVNNPNRVRDLVHNYWGDDPALRISRQQAARRINFRQTRDNRADFEPVRFSRLDDFGIQKYRPRYSGDGEWPPEPGDAHYIAIEGGLMDYYATPNPASAGMVVSLNPGRNPAGMAFAGWTSNYVDIQNALSSASARFTMIDERVTVTANFVPRVLAPPSIIINQVYGQGSPGGNAISHGFIELYNPTDAPINLGGFSLQAAIGSGERIWDVIELPYFTMQPRTSFLVVSTDWYNVNNTFGPGDAPEGHVPRYILQNWDFQWDVRFNNNNMVVALVEGNAPLSRSVVAHEWETIVDLVGVHNNSAENTAHYLGSGPAGNISRQASVRRINFQNTRDNAEDFVRVDFRYPVDYINARPGPVTSNRGITNARLEELRPRWSGDGEWPVEKEVELGPAHAITIIGGGMGASANPNPASANQTVILNAGSHPAGQTFAGWESDDVIIQNAQSPTAASFIMIDEPVTITASFEDLVLSESEVIIHQIYTHPGDGGNNSINYSFIELYNPTSEQVYLGNYSLQIQIIGNNVPTNLTPTNWAMLPLNGWYIDARSSLLIVSKVGGSTQVGHQIIGNRYDIEWNLTFNNRNLSVALVNNQVPLSPMITTAEMDNIIDLVGAVNDTPPRDMVHNYFGDLPAWRISRQRSVRRINFQNSRNNRADFESISFENATPERWDTFRPRYSGDGEWPDAVHAITIIGGGDGASANPNPASQGQTVTLNAGTAPQGQMFVGWESDDVVIENAQSPTAAMFIMIDEPVTVTASFVDLVLSETDVIIHQIYAHPGDIGNNAISYSFIELYNPTNAQVYLGNYSLQAQIVGNNTPANLTPVPWNVLELTGWYIEARSSLLVVSKIGGSTQAGHRAIGNSYDIEWNLTFNNRNLSVALVSNQVPLSPMITAAEMANVIDLIGAVNDNPPRDMVHNYLGNLPAWRISRQRSVRRINFQNTRDNRADFESISFESATPERWDAFRPRYSGDGVWSVTPMYDLLLVTTPSALDVQYDSTPVCEEASDTAVNPLRQLQSRLIRLLSLGGV